MCASPRRTGYPWVVKQLAKVHFCLGFASRLVVQAAPEVTTEKETSRIHDKDGQSVRVVGEQQLGR